MRRALLLFIVILSWQDDARGTHDADNVFPETQVYKNCREAFEAGATASGSYYMFADGEGPSDEADVLVYCDHHTFGMGWQLVANAGDSGGWPPFNSDFQAEYDSMEDMELPYSGTWDHNLNYYRPFSDEENDWILFKAGDGVAYCAFWIEDLRTEHAFPSRLNARVVGSGGVTIMHGQKTNVLNRGVQAKSDPFIGCEGDFYANPLRLLWGENEAAFGTTFKNLHGGIGVFVRRADVTPPSIARARVPEADHLKIHLAFDEAVVTNSPQPDDFYAYTVGAGGRSIAVSSVDLTNELQATPYGETITVVLTEKVAYGETVYCGYFKSNSTELPLAYDRNVGDVYWNPVGNFLTIVDNQVLPIVVNTSAQAALVEVMFAGELENGEPYVGDYTVVVDGVVVQVAAVSTVKGFLEMHLRTALYDPMQPVTLSYAQSSSRSQRHIADGHVNPFTGAGEPLKVATFEDQTIRNIVQDTTAPRFAAARIVDRMPLRIEAEDVDLPKPATTRALMANAKVHGRWMPQGHLPRWLTASGAIIEDFRGPDHIMDTKFDPRQPRTHAFLPYQMMRFLLEGAIVGGMRHGGRQTSAVSLAIVSVIHAGIVLHIRPFKGVAAQRVEAWASVMRAIALLATVALDMNRAVAEATMMVCLLMAVTPVLFMEWIAVHRFLRDLCRYFSREKSESENESESENGTGSAAHEKTNEVFDEDVESETQEELERLKAKLASGGYALPTLGREGGHMTTAEYVYDGEV
eukprot:g630.t1